MLSIIARTKQFGQSTDVAGFRDVFISTWLFHGLERAKILICIFVIVIVMNFLYVNLQTFFLSFFAHFTTFSYFEFKTAHTTSIRECTAIRHFFEFVIDLFGFLRYWHLQKDKFMETTEYQLKSAA